MLSPKFLSIQASYTTLQMALFDGKNKLKQIEEANEKASSKLVPYIKKILEEYNLHINSIQFICTNQGPGAFTSLRVAIATINGISFASKIPLIGIDGLDALSQETLKNIKLNSEYPDILISLLNAYNNEVYFAIYSIKNKKLEIIKENKFITKGYKKIEILLNQIKNKFNKQKILFTGNGAILYKDLIKNSLNEEKIIFSSQEVCSAKQIAIMALDYWEKQKNLKNKLYPLYLKSQYFAVRPSPNTSNTS